jgi:hypothetical protein
VLICGPRSPAWPSRASSRGCRCASGPTSWCSIATRSASVPRARARRPPRGWRPWASPGRSAPSFPACRSRPRAAERSTACRGAGRASTTASCASRCGSSAATPASRPRRSRAAPPSR